MITGDGVVVLLLFIRANTCVIGRWKPLKYLVVSSSRFYITINRYVPNYTFLASTPKSCHSYPPLIYFLTQKSQISTYHNTNNLLVSQSLIFCNYVIIYDHRFVRFLLGPTENGIGPILAVYERYIYNHSFKIGPGLTGRLGTRLTRSWNRVKFIKK